MKDRAVLSIPSHPKFLCIVRAVTRNMAEASGIDETTAEDLKLAVDEACSNVIKYAYKGAEDKKITVKYKVSHKSFTVTIEDNGLKAPRGAIRGRDLEDLRAGGLGVHFIRRAFDTCEFDRRKKTGNRLRLVRHLGASDED